MTELMSPQVLTDRHRNYMSGSVMKPRIYPLGDMIGAWKDRKPRVLMDLPASSTGTAILDIEAIIVPAHPNEGPKSKWDYK